jgi:hypothetical protein
MHLHTSPTNALGSSLAERQGTEAAIALRRARELRESALKQRILGGDVVVDLSDDSQAVAMVGAWVGNGGSPASAEQRAPLDRDSTETGHAENEPAAPVRSVQPGSPSAALSFWA